MGGGQRIKPRNWESDHTLRTGFFKCATYLFWKNTIFSTNQRSIMYFNNTRASLDVYFFVSDYNRI